MKFIIACALLVASVVIFSSVEASSATPSDQYLSNSDLEARLVAELAARIARAARISPFGYMGGFPTQQVGKRNSELINSLLGLPKVMNDAGK